MKHLFTRSRSGPAVRRLKQLGSLALLWGSLAGAARAQTVAFPRNADFTGTDASGFTLGGSARLTAATGGPDAGGTGTLRLTDAVEYQAGYAIDNSTFATPNGFSISFEFFSYGSTSQSPADGFSVFLVDGAGTNPTASPSQFTIGASGGSLGYAQKTDIPGASKGYLGIGIDEFGNYSNPTEGRIGGPRSIANAVAVRGPYDPTNPVGGYNYIAGSEALGFNLYAGGTTRITDPNNAGYRKAYINLIPVTVNGTVSYRISVRIQNGQNLVTAVDNVTVTNPPATLRVGFAGSTGGSNSIHEIRGLRIVQAPVANNDNASTRYNAPVTFSVLTNDQVASGAPAIAPGTVDLNPNTVALDQSVPVSVGGVNAGTFSVNNAGDVTFTPSGLYSGTVSIPYTVNNVNGNTSNVATISVVVTGADVATTVSGPTTVNPSSSVTYTVTTTNNGRETATNVIPTLVLPTGVTWVSGGSYNTNTRTVSFPQTTLAANTSATNSVQVTMPTGTGNVSLTSNYVYPGTTPAAGFIPDAVASNNASTLTVNVTGSANITGVCAIPGKDGPATLTASSVVNTYYAGVAAASGASIITVNTTPTGNTATPIAAGDLLLIMQMQGATMTITNTAAYGTVTSSTAGQYEYAIAAGAVQSNGRLALTANLSNTYTANVNTGRTFQVIRVPQYSSLTLSGTVTGLAWNGSTGGVFAVDVAGTTTFNTGASVTMDGQGFRGAAGVVSSASATSNGLDNNTYVTTSTAVHGAKGESIAGTTAGYNTYAAGSYARGEAANGGGGGNNGTNNNGQSFVVTSNAGGGGGGNGSAGATGASTGTGNRDSRGGIGGNAVPNLITSYWYLGGAGGAGSTSGAAANSSGGDGGGIIIIRSASFSKAAGATALVTARGAAGSNAGTTNTPGGGGGGAGGTVVLTGSGLSALAVNVSGGAGGTGSYAGGAGGGGIVYSNGNEAPTITGAGSNATATVGGTTGAGCLPTLTTSLRTTTPQVVRNGNTVSPATYVFTISNTGGGFTGLRVTPALAVNGASNVFTYASTTQAVLQYADNTPSRTLVAGTDYTAPTAGSSSPVFALNPDLVIPAGATVEFTFRANIASSAADNTGYRSNAATTLLNPVRTTDLASTTITGPDYTSSGSSADIVTITQPLPVQLTKFAATAVGADAVLTWTTAQELNNQRFVVERSIDATHFEAVGTVAGQGTTTQAHSYRFTDAGAAAHATSGVAYYRLRQIDFDGQDHLTQVQAVAFRRTAVLVFPNPTTGSATLDLSSLPAGTYQVQVLEATGRVLLQHTCQAGQQKLPVASLPVGTYFVKVQGAGINTVLPLIRQ